MSFDFGTRNESDPTSDFVSKFPDLDGAGGDDALLSSAAAAPAAASNNALDDDDLLGGGGSSTAAAAAAAPAPAAAGPSAEEHSKEAFESNFPELDDPDLATPVEVEQPAATMQSTSNGYMAPPMTSTDRPTSRSGPTYNAPLASDPYGGGDLSDEEEPEPLRTWRHAQADSIAQRSAAAERKKGEVVSKAERDIDEFYREYNAKKEKSIKKNKEDEARETEMRNRQLAEGTTWDRVTKLVGLENSQSKTIAPTGGTDLARYREILLSLRREGQTAPAAGGY